MNINELKDKFTVYVFSDSSLTEAEKTMLIKAMEDTAPVYGCHFLFSESGVREESLSSGDEIIARAHKNLKGQLSASDILGKLQDILKKKQLKGAIFLFTSKDLYLKKTWCFGAARVGGGVSVQSMARFRDLEDDVKQAVITRTLRHELGHVHKCAADPKRPNTESKYGMHCTCPGCTMRQSPTLKALIEHALEEDPADCLCRFCKEDLRKFKEENY